MYVNSQGSEGDLVSWGYKNSWRGIVFCEYTDLYGINPFPEGYVDMANLAPLALDLTEEKITYYTGGNIYQFVIAIPVNKSSNTYKSIKSVLVMDNNNLSYDLKEGTWTTTACGSILMFEQDNVDIACVLCVNRKKYVDNENGTIIVDITCYDETQYIFYMAI